MIAFASTRTALAGRAEREPDLHAVLSTYVISVMGKPSDSAGQARIDFVQSELERGVNPVDLMTDWQVDNYEKGIERIGLSLLG